MAIAATKTYGSMPWIYITDSVFSINQHSCASSCGIQDRSKTSMFKLISKRARFELMARI